MYKWIHEHNWETLAKRNIRNIKNQVFITKYGTHFFYYKICNYKQLPSQCLPISQKHFGFDSSSNMTLKLESCHLAFWLNIEKNIEQK